MGRKDTCKGLDAEFDVSNRVIAGELSGIQFSEGVEVEMS